MKKTDKKLLSMSLIDPNFIPSINKDKSNYYDNKKLSEFDEDDFASLIIDNSDAEGNFLGVKGLTDKYDIFFLNNIPKMYTRIYLYGAWNILYGFIKYNMKHNSI